MHFLDYDPDESGFAEELYYGDDWQWDDEEWYDETQFDTFEERFQRSWTKHLKMSKMPM